MRCSAVKVNGSPCRASAVHADLNGHCVFHSSLSFPGQRQRSDLTKAEVIRTIGREIRVLRRAKGANPVERADALRNLILVWQQLSAPKPEPVVRPMSFKERVREFESESGR